MKKLVLSALMAAMFTTQAQAAVEEVTSPVQNQEELSKLSAKMNNPLADLWLLFTQNDYYAMEDAMGNEYNVNSFKFQPVMSFDFSENYNLIVRPTLQHMSVESPTAGVDDNGQFFYDPNGYDASGMGDSGVLAALGPKQPVNGWILGGGITTLFPTAKEAGLSTAGADQTLVGPAIVALRMTDTGAYGAVIQHFEGVGSSELVDANGQEEDVSLTDIQYVFRHKINPTTQVGFAPNIQIDWNKEGSDRFSIPVGFGIDTVTRFGRLPVRLGVEAYKYVEQNDMYGPEWGIRLFAIPVVPKMF